MHILANANIPREAVERLRSHGHDVVWAHTEARSAGDSDVLARVAGEERLMVTFDKDFAELAYAAGLPARAGVVLLRFAPVSAAAVAKTVAEVMESRDDWAGRFSVVEERLVRMAPLLPRGARR